MRKSLLFLAFSISTLFVLGQGSPNAFNYSAVARDGAGSLVTNQAIALQMSILQSTAVGSLVYQETHNVSTDDYGLFNLLIGSGAIQQGTFSSINWAGDSYYLKIEMDITGSTNYTNMGTTQFLSVPYAMHSKTADITNETDPVYNAWDKEYTVLNNKPIVVPRIASKGQELSVSFSGSDTLLFNQATSPTTQVMLRHQQSTSTINIYPINSYYINSKRFDAVFQIPFSAGTGTYDIIFEPSLPSAQLLEDFFKIF
jgi:hypothetical protein